MNGGDLIKPLHGLRGLAALIVVVHHLAPLEFSGAIGVTLFFVLSGFLMGRLYLTRDFNTLEVWRYLSARFARVYPLFALVILTAAASNTILGFSTFNLKNTEIIEHLLLFGDAMTVWTIAVESHFYLLFLLAWALRAKGLLGLRVLLGLFVILSFGANFADGRIDTFRYLHIFVAGMIVARLSDRPSARTEKISEITLPVMAAAFFFLASQEVDVYANMLVILVAAGFVFTSVAAQNSFFGKLLSIPPLIFLGEISYGIYLLHRIAQQFIIRFLGTWDKSWLSFSLGMALTLVLSFLVYKAFENPAREALRSGFRSIESKLKKSPFSP